MVRQVFLGGAEITIGDCVNIGAGARVISSPNNPIIIGDFVKIGAGAVVTKNVSSFSIVAGVPATRLRTITMDEIRETWGEYFSAEDLSEISCRLAEIDQL